MRRALIGALCAAAERDRRVVLLTGDLGYTVVEPFAERFPGRFFNAGVAEQNMLGMAAGLAEAGYLPFAYSIATFASMRAFEFVRDAAGQGLPVRVIGVGAGFDYGHAGYSHFALEDLGLMRAQPGVTVVSPADHQQAAAALEATWDLPTAVYYRVGKDDTVTVPGLEGAFDLGRAVLVGSPGEVLLVATGAVAVNAVTAAGRLAAEGIRAATLVVASFNPAPDDDLLAAADSARLVVSVEAHRRQGGLGGWAAEVLAGSASGTRLVRLGVDDPVGPETGSTAFLEARHGLDPAGIASAVLSSVAARP